MSGAFGTRDDVVRRIRQRRILAAFYPLLENTFEGNASGGAIAGHYWTHDGCGNSFLVCWDASGVVALAFDHDSPESEWGTPERERDPGRHLPNVPRAMSALKERAVDYGERLATEGFWISAGPTPSFGQSERLDILEQLKGDETGEVWMAGVPEYGALASRLAASDPAAIGAEEVRAILGATSGRDRPLEVADVERAAASLAEVGVVWRDAVVDATPTIEAMRREREALFASPDAALVKAALEGDLAAAKESLARGANVDAPMSKDLRGAGPWHPPDGATPLLIAMMLKHRALALHLIEAGADLDASIPGGRDPKDPLRIAAGQGDVELTRRLLGRPSRVPIERRLNHLSDDAGRARGVEAENVLAIARLFLEAGAPAHQDAYRLLAHLADTNGQADLAALLRPVGEP